MAGGCCLFQGQAQEVVGVLVVWSGGAVLNELRAGESLGGSAQWGWGSAEPREGSKPLFPGCGAKGESWSSGGKPGTPNKKSVWNHLAKGHIFSGGETETQSKVVAFPRSQGMKLNERQVSRALH